MWVLGFCEVPQVPVRFQVVLEIGWFRVFPGGSGRSGCGFWRYWHAGRWGGCARSSPLRCSVPEVPVLVPAEALVQVPRSVSVLVFKARDSYILKGGQWLIWPDSS